MPGHSRNHRLKELSQWIAVLSFFMAMGAGAQPYEFLALYQPLSGTGDTHAIRLDAAEGALLPDGGEGYQLDRLVVRFKSDALSASALASFSGVSFTVKVGNTGAATKKVLVDVANIEKLSNREQTLLSWKGDGSKEPLANVQIDSQVIYSRDFLCSQEKLLLVEAEDPQNKTAFSEILVKEGLPPAGKDGKPTPPAAPGPSDQKILRAPGGPWILYSFCRVPAEPRVDWDKLANVLKPDAPDYSRFTVYKADAMEGPITASALRKAHKQALAKLIVTQLNKKFPSFAKASVDTDDQEYEDALIHVADQRSFAIIKSAGALIRAEESGGELTPLTEVIDQDSEVILELNPDVCRQRPPGELLKAPWTVELEVPDKQDEDKTQKVKVDLDFRNGCSRKLMVRWPDHVKQQVTLRLIYRMPDQEDIVVSKDSFTVHNLGLITTAPLISEINSAVNGVSLRDVEATSSIPVSFAMSVRENRKSSYAVTFPFTLSVNTHSFPNLAEYFALAPSLSLVGGGAAEGAEEQEGTGEEPPPEQGPSFRLAIGMGVNVARAFHFGYAWAPKDGGRYVLIGVSVPELLPLFK